MTSDRDVRIRERAYNIWVEDGRVDGKHDEHWHRAEREVADEDTKIATPARPKRPAASSVAPSEAGPTPGEAAPSPTRKPRAKPATKADIPEPALSDTDGGSS